MSKSRHFLFVETDKADEIFSGGRGTNGSKKSTEVWLDRFDRVQSSMDFLWDRINDISMQHMNGTATKQAQKPTQDPQFTIINSSRTYTYFNCNTTAADSRMTPVTILNGMFISDADLIPTIVDANAFLQAMGDAGLGASQNSGSPVVF
ncbi:hypothetical protein IFR04_010244 [Cadophora malorum]|uniref:Uncharacterized protein n=1 Tax=Cadophora malorum TaxID=108018 RepID=A0A8H7TD16_9HELO|nr:hypothetical protein IFR04_010244 [Cadophora malorum]